MVGKFTLKWEPGGQGKGEKKGVGVQGLGRGGGGKKWNNSMSGLLTHLFTNDKWQGFHFGFFFFFNLFTNGKDFTLDFFFNLFTNGKGFSLDFFYFIYFLRRLPIVKISQHSGLRKHTHTRSG